MRRRVTCLKSTGASRLRRSGSSDPPSRLVYTFDWETLPLPATRVEIDLEERDGETELHLRHTDFESPDVAMDHRSGWEQSLGRLADLLQRRDDPGHRRRHPGLLLLAGLLLGVGVQPAAAQLHLTEHTMEADGFTQPPAASLEDVSWLAGRWLGEGLGAVAEETWLPPSGGAMAGIFRLVREGSVDFYEIVTLVEAEGTLCST